MAPLAPGNAASADLVAVRTNTIAARTDAAIAADTLK
jgi:hypothetical protein